MAKRKAQEVSKSESDLSSLSATPELVNDEQERPSKKRQTKARKPNTRVKNGADRSEVDQPIQKQEAAKVKATTARANRKSKAQKEAEEMPLAARTLGHSLYIGAHVSGAGGVHNSVANSVHVGANAFALFLRSQRKWANPPLTHEVRDSFIAKCNQHKYDQAKHVVPHGSYLVNLAHTDHDRTQQAYETFVDDLKRCHELGIRLYNFHPGNCGGRSREESIKHLAGNINRAHKDPGTGKVVTLLENMASSTEGSNVLGGRFEDLRDIIELVEDKERVGVCLDTCHAFAAGYDLRSKDAFEATMDKVEKIIGTKYLRAVHMNDSKAPLASCRDLHANIGTGFLGLRAFYWLVNDKRFNGLPLVLETPTETPNDEKLDKTHKVKEGNLKKAKGTKEDKSVWAREIKLLESLVGMDLTSDEFKTMETVLAKKGEAARTKMMEQFEKKKKVEAAKGAKGKKKKKGKKLETLAGGESLDDSSDG